MPKAICLLKKRFSSGTVVSDERSTFFKVLILSMSSDS